MMFDFTRRSQLSIIVFCIFFLAGSILFSQTDLKQKLDSLYTGLQKDSTYIYRFRKVRPYIKYTERNSIGNRHPVNFWGPQFGIVLFERHILGLSYNLSSQRTRKEYYTYADGGTPLEGIDMRYGTFFYQYILVNRKYYELHLPVEGGYGYYHATYRNPSQEIYRTVNEPLLLFGGGVNFLFKPVRWIGIAASLGIRKSDHSIVDGVYYMLGIRIMIRPLKNDINYYLIKKKKYRENVAKLQNNT